MVQHLLVRFFVDNKNNVRMSNRNLKGVNTLVHKGVDTQEAYEVCRALNFALESAAYKFDEED
jgi:hypothetical protein